MKSWLLFVGCTILCWGAYVPTLHTGQLGFGGKGAPLRAFLFVGVAYFMVAAGVLVYTLVNRAEPLEFVSRGVSYSTLAGILGALGALGIIFAIRSGGKPIAVAPLVFAGAPIVNTFVSMMWHRPEHAPRLWFYFGILLAGVGAALVLRFKPS